MPIPNSGNDLNENSDKKKTWEVKLIKSLKRIMNKMPSSKDSSKHLRILCDEEYIKTLSLEYEGEEINKSLTLLAIQLSKKERDLAIIILNFILKKGVISKGQFSYNEFTFAVAGLQLTNIFCELEEYQSANNTLNMAWEKLSQFKYLDPKGNTLYSKLKDFYLLFLSKFHLTLINPSKETFRLLSQMKVHDIMLDSNLYGHLVLMKALAYYQDQSIDEAIKVLSRCHKSRMELQTILKFNRSFSSLNSSFLKQPFIIDKSSVKWIQCSTPDIYCICEDLHIYLLVINGEFEEAKKRYDLHKSFLKSTVPLKTYIEKLEKRNFLKICIKVILLWRLEDSYIRMFANAL
ncbi:hypothetical protein HMI56_006828 [Coelomomyces lativittatus]|nr:hypothetical protein HMI56_006828 [Coelomomyces lativittatus]